MFLTACHTHTSTHTHTNPHTRFNTVYIFYSSRNLRRGCQNGVIRLLPLPTEWDSLAVARAVVHAKTGGDARGKMEAPNMQVRTENKNTACELTHFLPESRGRRLLLRSCRRKGLGGLSISQYRGGGGRGFNACLIEETSLFSQLSLLKARYKR